MIAGYDAAPIDGVDGPKTQAALAAFLKSRGLSADVVQSPNFFATMVDAVQSPSATGLTWCNDTPHKVMAAVATDDGKAVTSRGWYRIDPGKCLHPDVTGQPKQMFSFAEAVDGDNRTIKLKDKPLNWGGDDAALHPREQVRDQRAGRLRHAAASPPPALPRSTCAAAARRCALRCRDEVIRTNNVVVPREQPSGTHNHRTSVCRDDSTATARLDDSRRYGSPPSRGRQEEGAMTNHRAFAHVDTWVFDLDNTLYPHHVNLWQQVDARIGEFVSAVAENLAGRSPRGSRRTITSRYGTTMRGMMTEHGVHADDYLAYVHKIDHSPLEPNPAMGEAIAKLPGRKLILTNGSVDHVDAVLERLGSASISRRVRHHRRRARAEAGAADLPEISARSVGRSRRSRRCSRISRAISWCRTSSA